LKILRRR